MPAAVPLVARPGDEWTGTAVRRYTRRATAARADTSWLTRAGDLLSGLTSAGVPAPPYRRLSGCRNRPPRRADRPGSGRIRPAR